MNRSECSWYTKYHPASSFNSIFKHEKPKAYRNENALVDHRDPTYILATRIPNRKGIEISLCLSLLKQLPFDPSIFQILAIPAREKSGITIKWREAVAT